MEVADICRMVARSIAAEIGPWGDHCALFGGLVPGLLVPEPTAPLSNHIGTRDIDLAIRVAAVGEDAGLYRSLKQNLAALGLTQNSSRTFEWSRTVEGFPVLVELFVPVDAPVLGGKIQRKPIEQSGSGLTALGLYGLDLIQRDIVEITDEGPLLDQNGLKRVKLRVCGPAMLIGLKAWALHDRNKSKDGYDVIWVLRAMGVEVVAKRFIAADLHKTEFGVKALEYLDETFASHQQTGPAGWIIEAGISGDDGVREARDAAGLVQEFVARVRES